MKLNQGQQNAVNAITSGANVFLTGEGGTGKSVAVRAAVDALAAAGRKVVLCAPTGVAAHEIGGATIHSAFRFDLAPKVADELESVLPSKIIAEADTVIIDEIGMVRRDLMDAIARVVALENEARIENPEKKRLQLIVVGDFSQLPPVVTNKDKPALVAEYGKETAGSGFYAFEGAGWDGMGFHVCMLDEPMRQADPEFVQMLNRARVGDVSCLPYFNKLAGREVPPAAVSIVATNNRAADINAERLRALDGDLERFRGDVEGEFKTADMSAPQTLELKVGARVMTLANDKNAGYINGSTGVVTDLHGVDVDGMPCIRVKLDSTGAEVPVKRNEWENVAYEVEEKDGKKHLKQVTLGKYTQYPLKLAYAITYHKSQGQTLEAVSIDPSTFAPGQLYVGLSRAKTAAGIYLTKEIQPKNLIADPAVVEFYEDGCGWAAPAPAMGDETPDTSKTGKPVSASTVARNSTEKANSKPKKPAPKAAAAPSSLAEIEGELHDLLNDGTRSWVRVYELIDLVSREAKYKPDYRSFSAWIKAEAEREGVAESILWHRKSAGDFYAEWSAKNPAAPTLAEGKHLSENNLNLVRKIAKENPSRGDELMAEMLTNQMSTKALQSEWRAASRAKKEAAKTPDENPAAAPKCVAEKAALKLSLACENAADFERVLAVLKAAGVDVREV